jgi:hypothetical protein
MACNVAGHFFIPDGMNSAKKLRPAALNRERNILAAFFIVYAHIIKIGINYFKYYCTKYSIEVIAHPESFAASATGLVWGSCF